MDPIAEKCRSVFCSYVIMVMLLLIIISESILFCYGDEGYACSRATFYGSPDCQGSPSGACGFGEYGRTVNDGMVSGVSRLFKNGTGCGACYQVRCKIPTHCSEEGTKVVVTDFGAGGHYADFIMNVKAYGNLARPGMGEELFGYGVVDVEYKRIACNYGSANLVIKIHERSKFPHYLAFLAIYQAGQYDILAAQLWLEDCKEWTEMRRVYGAVFDMQNPPFGAINLRFQVSNAYGEVKYVQFSGVIPSDWKPGVAYDTAFQFSG